MVRPVGGKAVSNQRTALPSSMELLGDISSSSFAGVPTAASTGAFGDIEFLGDIDRFYNPQSFGEANRRNQAGEALAPGLNSESYYIDDEGNYVDRSSYRQSYDQDIDTGELTVPGYKGPQEDEGTAAAPLTVVPTSSSNPARPRTVAAGYDKVRGVLTVVFRDGTFYNYYEVTSGEWNDFKRRVSKGQYIYKYLDFKPRGPANVRSIPAGVRKEFYRYARISQLSSRGKQYNTKSRKK
jgi:hypothetical protein